MSFFSTDEDHYHTWTDSALLEASRKRPWLFAELVSRYEAPFLRRVQRILYNERDAEEVVQDAFTKIYLNAHRFVPQPGATFSSWAYRILLNTAFTAYQRQVKLGKQVQLLDPEFEALLAEEKSNDTETTDMVVRLLAKIPTPLATVLRLHYLERWPQQDIATHLGISVGAVKVRIFRAKQAVKENQLQLADERE
jgi:RNA polymerase sigma factor (sigma-70 family)